MGELEVRLLLEAIYDRYHFDFRSYAMASLKRRLAQACDTLRVSTLSSLQEKVLHEPESFSTLLQYLTVQVSDMFRDPEFFLALRTRVLPVLATYPSIKVWCAGCSTGEEAYALAILLQEDVLEHGRLVGRKLKARNCGLRALAKAAIDAGDPLPFGVCGDQAKRTFAKLAGGEHVAVRHCEEAEAGLRDHRYLDGAVRHPHHPGHHLVREGERRAQRVLEVARRPGLIQGPEPDVRHGHRPSVGARRLARK